jgi:deoxycytidine triphosphate deaminase
MSIYTSASLSIHNGHHFVIHPYDEACASPLGYDLRIGLCVLIDGDRAYEPDGNKIEIPSKCSAFIITKEHVWLSDRVVGTIHARGSLAAKGLMLNSTTVDPNWRGQMTMLIHNLNSKPLILEKDERFSTMILHGVMHSTAATPGKNPLRVAHEYGNVYGKQFTGALSSFIALDTQDLRQFNRLVDSAHTATWLNRWVVYRARRLFNHLRNRRAIALGILVLLILAIGSVQPMWPLLQRITGMTQQYDPSVLVGQLSAIVSLVAIIITILLTSGDNDGKH